MEMFESLFRLCARAKERVEEAEVDRTGAASPDCRSEHLGVAAGGLGSSALRPEGLPFAPLSEEFTPEV
jgi:hypothetical protein